jgi:hypothetical protein
VWTAGKWDILTVRELCYRIMEHKIQGYMEENRMDNCREAGGLGGCAV